MFEACSNGYKIGVSMMSTRVYAGNLPLGATEEQLRELVAPQTGVPSARMAEAEFRDLSHVPGWSGRPVPVESSPVEVHSYLAPAAIPVWMDGTLSGAMAGRRPAASRPAQSGGALFSGRAA